MPRRIPPKVARKVNAKVHNVSKLSFWFVLGVLGLAAYAVWATFYILTNRDATLIGHSVACVERPAAEYFQACNALWDGPACQLESRSRMLDFYEPIDYACAKTEPPKQFRFPVSREPAEVEYAEKG